MSVTVYKSTDASAPTLQGVVGGAYSSGWTDGSLLQLLKKCLVDGYGSQVGAGWTLPFTATSHGTFKQGAGCGFYLDVLDDGSLTAGAKEAQFNGFETASAVGTGTGAFPTSAQQTTFLKMRKSDTADTTVNPWIVIADNRTVIVLAWSNASSYFRSMYFGDFKSLVPGDAFNCIAVGRVTTASVDAVGNETLNLTANGTSMGTAIAGHYVARPYNQFGTAVQFAKIGGSLLTSISTVVGSGNGSFSLPFPNSSDSGLYLAKNYLIDPSTVPTKHLRGWLRGLWAIQHSGASVPVASFAGAGTLAGRTFTTFGKSDTSSGLFCLEISNTWD